MMEYEKYQKGLPYTYVFGAYGTIELLKNQKEQCLAILIDPSFIHNDAYGKILALAKNIPVVVDQKTIKKIRDKENIYVIGVFKKYMMQIKDTRHIVLYHIHDYGTIGTIIRSMNGFNFHSLILIDCVEDCYDEHLIRSTMGSFFQVSTCQYATFLDYTHQYPNQKYYNLQNQEGNPLEETTIRKDAVSFVFSIDSIKNSSFHKILIPRDLAIENIVNILLFTIYQSE